MRGVPAIKSVGKTYGQLTVLSVNGRARDRHSLVLAKCGCGSLREYSLNCLRSGNTVSCGCWRPPATEAIGRTYGQLRVMAVVGKSGHSTAVLARCECGSERKYSLSSLLTGNTKSCGCWRHDTSSLDAFLESAVPIPDTGCWLWEGSTDLFGYGHVRFRGRTQTASRVAWQLGNGPIPDGLDVLHHCDTPGCVAVQSGHLFLGTDADNVADMISKGRNSRGESHCHAKLTEDDIREIRVLHKFCGVPRVELANQYGVRVQTVAGIVSGKSWRHVDALKATG